MKKLTMSTENPGFKVGDKLYWDPQTQPRPMIGTIVALEWNGAWIDPEVDIYQPKLFYDFTTLCAISLVDRDEECGGIDPNDIVEVTLTSVGAEVLGKTFCYQEGDKYRNQLWYIMKLFGGMNVGRSVQFHNLHKV